MQAAFGEHLNGFRARYGLAAVLVDPIVAAVAQGHAEDLARRAVLSHGSGPGNMDVSGDRLSAAGYGWSFAAENTAFGQPDPGAVLAAWEASPGHRAAMLSQQAVHFGFGGARNHIGPYWVLVLAAPLAG